MRRFLLTAFAVAALGVVASQAQAQITVQFGNPGYGQGYGPGYGQGYVNRPQNFGSYGYRPNIANPYNYGYGPRTDYYSRGYDGYGRGGYGPGPGPVRGGYAPGPVRGGFAPGYGGGGYGPGYGGGGYGGGGYGPGYGGGGYGPGYGVNGNRGVTIGTPVGPISIGR